MADWKETEKMRKLYLVGFLFLAGCQNVVGPFEHRKPERVDVSQSTLLASYQLIFSNLYDFFVLLSLRVPEAF